MRMHGDMAIGHVFLASPFPLFLSALEALLGTFGTLWGGMCVIPNSHDAGGENRPSSARALCWGGGRFWGI